MSDPSTIVQGATVVADAAPWVTAIVQAISLGVVTLVCAAVAKYFGLQIGADQQTKLANAADQIVMVGVSKAEDNLASRTFDVGSPLVAQMANQLLNAEPAIVTKLGLTGTGAANAILAAIGRVQASMTRVAPAASTPAAPQPAKT